MTWKIRHERFLEKLTFTNFDGGSYIVNFGAYLTPEIGGFYSVGVTLNGEILKVEKKKVAYDDARQAVPLGIVVYCEKLIETDVIGCVSSRLYIDEDDKRTHPSLYVSSIPTLDTRF